MKISIIVIISENNVIGVDNGLPWHLPADLKHFKETTMGHHIIMGRKTYESFKKALPGRTNIVITRQDGYLAEGCQVVKSIEEALEIARNNNEKEAFIIGGAEIYKQVLPLTNSMYLTRIHDVFEGDTYFPEYNLDNWNIVSQKDFKADEKNLHDYSIMQLDRVN